MTPQPKTEVENAISVGLRAMVSNHLIPDGGCLLSAAEEIDRLQSRLATVEKENRERGAILLGVAMRLETDVNQKEIYEEIERLKQVEKEREELRGKLRAYERARKIMVSMVGMKEHTAEWDNAILHFEVVIREELEAIP